MVAKWDFIHLGLHIRGVAKQRHASGAFANKYGRCPPGAGFLLFCASKMWGRRHPYVTKKRACKMGLWPVLAHI